LHNALPRRVFYAVENVMKEAGFGSSAASLPHVMHAAVLAAAVMSKDHAVLVRKHTASQTAALVFLPQNHIRDTRWVSAQTLDAHVKHWQPPERKAHEEAGCLAWIDSIGSVAHVLALAGALP
jgi:isoaspartyl peptidase/L-asparaginase-like protein (Ntn-hydrolase superfamily)